MCLLSDDVFKKTKIFRRSSHKKQYFRGINAVSYMILFVLTQVLSAKVKPFNKFLSVCLLMVLLVL